MTWIKQGERRTFVAQQGDGPPLLLVHGFPLDHSMWRRQLDGLQSDCHVIAPDLPGFGKSDSAGDVLTMAQLSDDLASLLDRLEVRQPVHLCGLSMGGYVAFEFWKRHGGRLASLILCDTKAEADAPAAADARLAMAHRVMTHGPHIAVEAMLPKIVSPQTAEQHPEIVEEARRMMLSTSPATIAAAQKGMAARGDFQSSLAEISAPALVICGEYDTISPPEQMQALAQAMPSAKFVRVPNAGHLAPLENAEAVNDSLRAFIQSQSPSP